jgi:hypothetical protein
VSASVTPGCGLILSPFCLWFWVFERMVGLMPWHDHLQVRQVRHVSMFGMQVNTETEQSNQRTPNDPTAPWREVRTQKKGYRTPWQAGPL